MKKINEAIEFLTAFFQTVENEKAHQAFLILLAGIIKDKSKSKNLYEFIEPEWVTIGEKMYYCESLDMRLFYTDHSWYLTTPFYTIRLYGVESINDAKEKARNHMIENSPFRKVGVEDEK